MDAFNNAVEEDEYKYIAHNGICEEDRDVGYLKTNYDYGFVEYRVVEETLI